MRSSEKIPQPDTGLGIHEAVFTSDGIFGSDRGTIMWLDLTPALFTLQTIWIHFASIAPVG
jgi:hypothetical protein